MRAVTSGNVQRQLRLSDGEAVHNPLSQGVTVKSKYSISLPRNIRVRLERVVAGKRRRHGSPKTPPSPNQAMAMSPTGKVALGPWTGPYANAPASPPSPTLYADMTGHSYLSVEGDKYLVTQGDKLGQLNMAMDPPAVSKQLMSEVERQMQHKSVTYFSQPKHTAYTKAHMGGKARLHQINQPRKMY